MAKKITLEQYNNLPDSEKRRWIAHRDGYFVYSPGGDVGRNMPTAMDLAGKSADRIGEQLNPNSNIPRNTENGNMTMNDFQALAPIVSPFITGLFGLGQSSQAMAQTQEQFNQGLAEQKRVNATNAKLALQAQEWQKQTDIRNYDYMVAENQLQKQREDTAHQREVADLKAAGLSPLANLQGSTTGNTVSQAMGVSPVVPQMDGTGLANLYATAMNNESAMAGIKMQLTKELLSAGSDLVRQKIQHKHERTQTELTFENKLAELKATFENNKDLKGIDFVNDIQKMQKDLDNNLAIIAEKGQQDRKTESAKLLKEHHIRTQEVKGKTESEIAQHNADFWSRAKRTLNDIADEFNIKSETITRAKNFGAEASLGAQGAGTGAQASGAMNNGYYNSDSKSENKVSLAIRKWELWLSQDDNIIWINGD